MLLHNRFLSTLNKISPLWMENFLSKQWILNGIYRKGSGDFFNNRFQSGNNCLTLKSFCRIILFSKNDKKETAEKECKWWYFLHLYNWTFDIRLSNFRFWTLGLDFFLLNLLNFHCNTVVPALLIFTGKL